MSSPEAYVDQMAAILDLPLDPDHRPGVVTNFENLVAIANVVMEFPLPETLEVAPIFQP